MFSQKSTQSSCINSRLVPDLFSDSFVEVGTVRVLELGPAQGDTVGFLNQFNCRLNVLDVVDEVRRIDAEYQELEDPDPELVLTLSFSQELSKKTDNIILIVKK